MTDPFAEFNRGVERARRDYLRHPLSDQCTPTCPCRLQKRAARALAAAGRRKEKK